MKLNIDIKAIQQLQIWIKNPAFEDGALPVHDDEMVADDEQPAVGIGVTCFPKW